MSFTKSFKTAKKLVADKTTKYNAYALIGTIKAGQHKDDEEFIQWIKPSTTMGELTYDPDRYSTVHVISGVRAPFGEQKKERPLSKGLANKLHIGINR